ncbi:MAG: aminotransferase class I/II-fold pyridoxal phosphate-dependent enzyme [Planctomycetota bacterium]
MNDRLRKLGAYPMVALEHYSLELQARGVRVFDFGAGDPIEPVAPPIRAALVDAVPTTSPYPRLAGRPDLRAAIAGYFRDRFGVGLDANTEILPTMGSTEALFHLPQVLVQVPSEKDLVLYGEPGDPVCETGALFAEAWTYAIPLSPENRYCADPETVPEAVLRRAAMVFLSSPHDPTGQVLPDSVFAAWVSAREEYGFTLVCDESQSDLYYGTNKPKSLLQFGRKGCLAVHTLSQRSAMAGYRSGFVAGCADTIAHYRQFRAAMGVTPQDFVQAASVVAWRDGAHVAARRELLGKKRAVMLQHFKGLGLAVHETDAGMYLWVQVPLGTNGIDHAAHLREHGILVVPGVWFGARQERYVRVALVPSLADCEAAVKAWPR